MSKRSRFCDSLSDNRKSKIANLKFGLLVGTMLFAFCPAAEAQQSKKIPRIGYLNAASLGVTASRAEAFRRGLREFGYVEGKNIIIEWRSGEGKEDRLPALAAELVRLKVDVIVTSGPRPTHSAKEATITIPIVMAQDPDPVGSGFVASLARPGGNITGLSTLAPEISGKRLELLKEIVSRISRVAVLGFSSQPGNTQLVKEAELAAAAYGVRLQYLDLLGPEDIETAFRAIEKGRAEAILMLVPGPILGAHRTKIAELAIKIRLPAIYHSPVYVEDGGLMSYGVRFVDLDRRAATYVNKKRRQAG
jgi:putative tryptophan/tyrosine transport system substrate-binding protein